jgi:hypothetical protein
MHITGGTVSEFQMTDCLGTSWRIARSIAWKSERVGTVCLAASCQGRDAALRASNRDTEGVNTSNRSKVTSDRLSYPVLSDLRRGIGLWTFHRLRLFALLARATCRWRWAWSIGGMILTGESGALVEWYWQGETEVLGEKAVPVPLCLPQTSRGQTLDRTWASAVETGDWPPERW